MPACHDYHLSRRRMLAASAGALFLPVCFPRVSFAKSHSSAPQDVIVQIFLRGGMDGLSLASPWNEPNYIAARPTLRLTAPGTGATAVIDPLVGNTAASPTAPGGQVVFGFHPAFAPLMRAYSDGKLAIIPACGHTGTTKSHFDAQVFMEVGRVNPTVATGWLGRHLATQTNPINPAAQLRAVGVADGLPVTLVGGDRALPIPDLQNSTGSPPSNLSNFDSYGLAGTTSTKTTRRNAIDAMYDSFGGDTAPVADTAIATIQLLNAIGAANYPSTIAAGNNPADYPTTALGNALRSSAALIDAQVGVEAIAINHDGWDTHSNHGAPNDPNGAITYQINQLASALSAFYADLIVGKGRSVIVVVISEFGRRLGQNGSAGTDHGYGGATLVLGNAVAGGRIITNWAGLSPAQPSTEVDVPVTIDYRDILSEIVVKRLGNGANLDAIFPGYAYTDRHVIGV